MAGMTLASMVSRQHRRAEAFERLTRSVAAQFFEMLEEAGMPPGVVNFCPGAGGDFGDALVAHPKTRFIAFTGSREVGLHINEEAAAPRRADLDQTRHPRWAARTPSSSIATRTWMRR